MGQPGIFVLKNTTTGKQYVGQSRDVDKQEKKQDSLMRNGRHYNSYIQQDYNKGHRFSFRVLEYCNQNQLNQRKNYWIRQLNTFNNGYNQTGRDKNNSIRKSKNHSQYHQIHQQNNNTKKENTPKDEKSLEETLTKKDNDTVKKIILFIILIGLLLFVYPPLGLFVFFLYVICYFSDKL